MDEIIRPALATLLISLRVAPMFAFAQPFTLTRVPATVRLMLAIALAAWLVAGNPQATWRAPVWDAGLPALAAGELLIGIALALALQLAFAALLTAGRTIDIQAGFGLAVLVDPTTRAQLPLAGTIFAHAAAAIFFATDGPASLLAIWAASLERAPLGAGVSAEAPAVLIGFMSTVFLMAVGVAGLVLMVLFLLDLAIAFLSRTLPQMNVLLLGFQVKTIAMLATLPLALALSASLLAGLIAHALDTMPLLV